MDSHVATGCEACSTLARQRVEPSHRIGQLREVLLRNIDPGPTSLYALPDLVCTLHQAGRAWRGLHDFEDLIYCSDICPATLNPSWPVSFGEGCAAGAQSPDVLRQSDILRSAPRARPGHSAFHRPAARLDAPRPLAVLRVYDVTEAGRGGGAAAAALRGRRPLLEVELRLGSLVPLGAKMTEVGGLPPNTVVVRLAGGPSSPTSPTGPRPRTPRPARPAPPAASLPHPVRRAGRSDAAGRRAGAGERRAAPAAPALRSLFSPRHRLEHPLAPRGARGGPARRRPGFRGGAGAGGWAAREALSVLQLQRGVLRVLELEHRLRLARRQRAAAHDALCSALARRRAALEQADARAQRAAAARRLAAALDDAAAALDSGPPRPALAPPRSG
eukprot:tig00021537_g22304.t1